MDAQLQPQQDDKEEKQQQTLPPQEQHGQPGETEPMDPQPRDHAEGYRAAGKLEGKVALITGGDSGIGRSVAVHYAKEGADVCISYFNEHGDAEQTQRWVEKEGRRCIIIPGDIGDEEHCRQVVRQCLGVLGGLNILVNNAAEQHEVRDLTELTGEQLERTFRINIFAMFYFAKAALPHMGEGGCIVNTTSITAYQGHKTLLDYASTKGAIVTFTRSLSESLVERGIRVNAVAPGPIWTPLIPASFDAEHVATFGANTPMGRPGQPDEVAPCFVFLASDDSSYMTGQVLHPNGGKIVNG
jgi:NAD(P)-dependent dehydrogenase (short-subunit alcohol dehydrogenase family)